jgi:hypothetical protein
MIIWLLYGAEGLGEFNESVKTGSGDSSPFYQVFHTGEKKLAKVHEAVVLWMRYISKDPACHAGIIALGDLLELVERGLLVVKVLIAETEAVRAHCALKYVSFCK